MVNGLTNPKLISRFLMMAWLGWGHCTFYLTAVANHSRLWLPAFVEITALQKDRLSGSPQKKFCLYEVYFKLWVW